MAAQLALKHEALQARQCYGGRRAGMVKYTPAVPVNNKEFLDSHGEVWKARQMK